MALYSLTWPNHFQKMLDIMFFYTDHQQIFYFEPTDRVTIQFTIINWGHLSSGHQTKTIVQLLLIIDIRFKVPSVLLHFQRIYRGIRVPQGVCLNFLYLTSLDSSISQQNDQLLTTTQNSHSGALAWRNGHIDINLEMNAKTSWIPQAITFYQVTTVPPSCSMRLQWHFYSSFILSCI